MNLPTADEAFLRTLTLLYVEDDDAARTQTEVFLRRRVGRLVSAPDGVAGLAAFKANAVNVVVTDIRMPGMDGLSMVEAIRQLAPRVPVIVTTAFEQSDYMMRAIDLGVDKYVVKPVRVERLEEALLSCAARLRGEEAVRQKAWLEAEAQRMRHREAIRILMAGIAHDFSNLLQTILIPMELAKADLPEDSEVRKTLEIANGSADQARQLSRRLTSLVAGGEEPDAMGELDAILREVVTRGATGTHVAPVFALGAAGAAVSCSQAALELAITNLVHNAREAMPQGGELRVASRLRDVTASDLLPVPAGRYIHVEFHDGGGGISAENLPMVFEPYFSTKERATQKGMGLGLALAETIIRTHKGCITAESTPGRGTTFHVLLPLASAQPQG
jgi:signal transduction histidine kinase